MWKKSLAVCQFVFDFFLAFCIPRQLLTPPPDEEGNTSTRSLGLLVARGTLLVLIAPVDGSEEIENPFVQAEDDE
jgi:hypothetical protein